MISAGSRNVLRFSIAEWEVWRSTTPVINDDVSNQSHTSYTNQLDKSKHYHDEILCEELDLLIKKKI